MCDRLLLITLTINNTVVLFRLLCPIQASVKTLHNNTITSLEGIYINIKIDTKKGSLHISLLIILHTGPLSESTGCIFKVYMSSNT